MNSKMFTENERYLMLALDHRESFRKLINPQNPEKISKDEASKNKGKIIESLKDKFSGVLIDQEYGLGPYKELQINKPFLLPMEESGYELVDNERINKIIYKCSDIKNSGASGAKILLYFNPDYEKSAKIQADIAKQALEDAHQNNLPLFLEIVTYQVTNIENVLRSVEYFLDNNIIPDVFKIEFPGSDYLSKKISNMLSQIPWILLSRGADYTLFKEQLLIASDNGCWGFLAGRSLWQDYFSFTKELEKEKFLKETLPSRFEEIKQIVLNS
jgi:tagatose-1,6-bisphosphate aldolase